MTEMRTAEMLRARGLSPDEIVHPEGLGDRRHYPNEDYSALISPVPIYLMWFAVPMYQAGKWFLKKNPFNLNARSESEAIFEGSWADVTHAIVVGIQDSNYVITGLQDAERGSTLEGEWPAATEWRGGAFVMDIREIDGDRIRVEARTEITAAVADRGGGKKAMRRVFDRAEKTLAEPRAQL